MTLAVRRRTGVEEGQEKRKKEKERARDWYQNGSTTKISFTLSNPALFGPFKTQGGDRSAPKLFPELLEEVTCSKKGL